MQHRNSWSKCLATPGDTRGRRSAPMRSRSQSRSRSPRLSLSEPVKRVRRPRLILIGSAFYLALIFGVMLWKGVSIEPEWVVLALLVIAIALGRGKSFIYDWAPFLLLFFAYEAMRGFASKTGFAPHDLSALERALFGGAIPTLVLQHAFYHAGVVSWQDVVALFFYFMHFPLPILVGFVFWINSRDH